MGQKKCLTLTNSDKEKIEQIIKKGREGRAVARAIVLDMKSRNYTNIEAAGLAKVTPRTVINICHYYEESGLDSALYDEARPGKPPKFDDRIKSEIVAKTCSKPPEGFDRWTLELLKEEVESEKIVDSISKESLRLILREHDLKPWQYKMWCVPKLDEKYIHRMGAILDLYEKDYDRRAPVVCLDEKPVCLRGDKREALAFSKGKPTRYDYEYTKNGSVNVYCAVEPLKGVYFNKVTETKKKKDFAIFLKEIYEFYKSSKKVSLVVDNYSTHFENALKENLGEKEGSKVWKKFDVYYTPTHGSCLNQAEIAIGMYSRQCLGKTRIDDIKVLKRKTEAWNRIINEKQVIIKWKFTKKKAIEKFNLWKN